MRARGLSAQERDLLQRNDVPGIRAYLGDEFFAACMLQNIGAVHARAFAVKPAAAIEKR